jgi:hypothetical protein
MTRKEYLESIAGDNEAKDRFDALEADYTAATQSALDRAGDTFTVEVPNARSTNGLPTSDPKADLVEAPGTTTLTVTGQQIADGLKDAEVVLDISGPSGDNKAYTTGPSASGPGGDIRIRQSTWEQAGRPGATTGARRHSRRGMQTCWVR